MSSAFTLARRAEIAPFIAMDFKRDSRLLEQAGRDIVHMEVGEPSAAPPRLVREAAIAALGGTPVSYTDALGLPALRERISQHYARAYGVAVDPGRVAITTGSSGGFIMAFLAMFDVGMRVAIPNPGYPAYRNIFKALGIEAVEIGVDASTGFLITPEMIEKADSEKKLDGLLVMSPANPTGVMIDDASLKSLAATCKRRDIRFISDEIYHGLTFTRPGQTALAFDDDSIIVNSFSKYYCMTGWRVGWLITPPDMMRTVEMLQQSLAIAAPTLSQIAAVAAFDATDELETIKAGYKRNRDILLEGLPGVGFDRIAPADGAFYLYLDTSRFSDDSTALCHEMLEKAGVSATPGVDFDSVNGHLSMRLAYAASQAQMVEGLKRMKAFFARR